MAYLGDGLVSSKTTTAMLKLSAVYSVCRCVVRTASYVGRRSQTIVDRTTAAWPASSSLSDVPCPVPPNYGLTVSHPNVRDD